jgi:hypothetical protein
MTLTRLVAAFSNVRTLPIEIDEVRREIVKLGFQDEIVFVEEESDPRKCHGVYYQFTKRDGVYRPPILVSLIIYSKNVDLVWKRIICAKELIHVMDHSAGKTKRALELEGMLDKLLGPLSTEDFGLADMMAAIDKLATYQALCFLFPDAAREEALARLKSEQVTIAQIADWAVLPVELVTIILSDAWPDAKTRLQSIE